MKLTDLEPEFYRYETRLEEGQSRIYRIPVASIAEAQCIFFACPKCAGGAGQWHLVEATFAGRGVPDNMGTHNAAGKPTRWNAAGTGFSDLTLTPSIQLEAGPPCCQWHGFVTNGEAA